MTVRSPVHVLAADLSEGTVVHVAAGMSEVLKKSGEPEVKNGNT